MPYKDLPEGQTNYCEACEEEARLDRTWKSHICGINTPTVKEEHKCSFATCRNGCIKNINAEPETVKEEQPMEWAIDLESIVFQMDCGEKESNYFLEQLKNLFSKTLAHQKEQQKIRIGMLRQWLNEDRITDTKKMVSNEDIIYWLNLK